MISRKEGSLQSEYDHKQELLQKALQAYRQNSEMEHLQILSRKGIIEQRKEEQEKRIAQAELEARTQASLEQQRKEEEERRKVQEDAKRRTVERLQREMKERDKVRTV
jgi:translation initiation factor 3 subunit A